MTPMTADRPRRVQLKRVKGWRMPENTVKVDRSTKWGNPFVVGQMFFNVVPKDVGACVFLYRDWIVDCERRGVGLPLHELRGKNLACWCRLCDEHKDGKPLGVECDECASCHADVLLELANRDFEPGALFFCVPIPFQDHEVTGLCGATAPHRWQFPP